MAWVSKKVFAILNGSEEGKDIIEKLPDMTDEEKDSALDKFFGNGGGGNAQAQDYAKAKAEDDEEIKSYNAEDDDYEKDIGEDEPSDDDIGSALADSEWRMGDETVGEWAKIIADDLGTDQKRVIDYIRQQDPDKINENTKMEDVVNWFYEERKEENKKKPKKQTIRVGKFNKYGSGDVFDTKYGSLEEAIKQEKNTLKDWHLGEGDSVQIEVYDENGELDKMVNIDKSGKATGDVDDFEDEPKAKPMSVYQVENLKDNIRSYFNIDPDTYMPEEKNLMKQLKNGNINEEEFSEKLEDIYKEYEDFEKSLKK